MSGTSRACLVLEVVLPALGGLLVHGVEWDCASVLGLQAEPLFQHRLGEVVSRSPWVDPALALKPEWEPPPPACFAGCPGGPLHGLLQRSGFEDVRLVEDGSWLDSTLGTRRRPSHLSSALTGLAQVVLKSGLRFVSQVGPHPKVQGSPHH